MVRVLEIIGKRPVGGVGTVMLNYQKFIDNSKVQMDYLIFGEQEESFDQAVKALGSEVYTYPALSGRQMGKMKLYMDEFLTAHEGQYQVIHLHAPYIAFLVFPVAKRHSIKARIIHSHATLYAESKKKAIRNRLLWSLCQKDITDRIGCSDLAGKFLFKEKPYVVLRNAIEKEKYFYDEQTREEIREQNRIADDTLVVGNVGRFSLQKNQTFLIDIFAELKKIHNNSVLWLVGDGETRSEVEHKIADYGLQDSVKLWGMTDNAIALYQAMDVMVMPSLFEGLPMVGVEAQASGLPCVFSTAITREVDIAQAAYLPLEATATEWAEASMKQGTRYTGENMRRSYDKELDDLGFNIRIEAKRLEDLYQAMADRR